MGSLAAEILSALVHAGFHACDHVWFYGLRVSSLVQQSEQGCM